MTHHKTHESLPSGFAYADRLQVESFMATGSIDGAAKVCMVAGAGELPRLACRLRPPREWSDLEREEYKAGFEAGRKGEADQPWASFEWGQGHLDAVASRMKWHLAYCTDHESGCRA